MQGQSNALKVHALETIQVLRHQKGGWVGLKKSKRWWRNTWMVPNPSSLKVNRIRNIIFLVPDKEMSCIQWIWFLCRHKSFWRGAKCSQIFGLWLKKFGPAQNVLGPVKGQGIRQTIECLFPHWKTLKTDWFRVKAWTRLFARIISRQTIECMFLHWKSLKTDWFSVKVGL